MKAIFIIGAPGTGKTTLTRRLLEAMLKASTKHAVYPTGWVPNRRFKIGRDEWRVLGVFHDDDSSYVQGTDKLSMGVQPHFIPWLQGRDSCNLVIEGDRLANVKTIQALQALDCEVVVYELLAATAERERRYVKRGSTQSPTFIKGRFTKVANVIRHCVQYGIEHHSMRNDTRAEQTAVFRSIMEHMV